MTRYTKQQIEQLSQSMKDSTIESLEYTEEDDYFTIITENGEFSFRFMADLTKEGNDKN